MDFINLPLILVILSVVGIVVVIVDFFGMRPKRLAIITELQKQYPNWQQEGSADAGQYTSAVELKTIQPTWLKETKSFLPIVLIVLILRSFIVEPFQIPSASMEPSLDIGDFILVNKFSYGLRLPVIRNKFIEIGEPERGDVMVFFPPHDERYFIKRVVGLPGDLIEYRDKVLFINGKEQSLSTVTDAAIDFQQRDRFVEQLGTVEHELYNQPRKVAQDFSYTVPQRHYFMMGDNRDNSSDSRYWGPVPEERIVGKAFAIWMHWKSWTSFPSFDRVGIIQ